MANENQEPNPLWDEYDWERFLQEQDKETERYLELLDKYSGDPHSKELIAIEMGWPLNWASEEIVDNASVSCEDPASHSEGILDPDSEQNPLYLQSVDFKDWLEKSMHSRLAELEDNPLWDELSGQIRVLSTLIWLSLGSEKDSEMGMLVAILKRALRTANFALNAALEAYRGRIIGRVRYKYLKDKLFELRDEIVCEIGLSRERFRKFRDGIR